MNIKEYIKDRATLVNTWLEETFAYDTDVPDDLMKAIRYMILDGGKRIRPVLLLAVLDTFDIALERGREPAVALECIHTYSLIHDDLPCMDDDDLRRGKPSCHVQFGEALAVLTGDALLTYAFEILTESSYLKSHPDTGLQIISILAKRAGLKGMVGGQVLDMIHSHGKVDEKDVVHVHEKKTAALITASLEIGGLLAECDATVLQKLQEFGYALGILFQVTDDILDATQPSEVLGKTPGKDLMQEKPSIVRVLGLEEAREKASFWEEKAHSIIFTQLTQFVLARSF